MTTGCDWLIAVDDCVGGCQLVSPGYPDNYPAGVRCSYLITSFRNSRVELIIIDKQDDNTAPVFLDIKPRLVKGVTPGRTLVACGNFTYFCSIIVKYNNNIDDETAKDSWDWYRFI